jgi:hypothetical protein
VSALALLACGEAESPRTPIILISIDTLRADKLGSYGNSRDTSPTLDRLAGEGVLFESFFYSGGGTLPSHVSMFTSLNPGVHGIENEAGRALEGHRVTLAEQLHDAGYATAGFTDSGWMLGYLGLDQGFEIFDDSGGRLAHILPKALRFIDAKRAEPFFLFIHTYDVHSEWNALPYECPGDYAFTYTGGRPLERRGEGRHPRHS